MKQCEDTVALHIPGNEWHVCVCDMWTDDGGQQIIHTSHRCKSWETCGVWWKEDLYGYLIVIDASGGLHQPYYDHHHPGLVEAVQGELKEIIQSLPAGTKVSPDTQDLVATMMYLRRANTGTYAAPIPQSAPFSGPSNQTPPTHTRNR